MGPGLHSSGRWLAGPPPCRADHSRKNSRSLMKTNHQWTQIDTNTDGPPSTTSGTKMLLQFCALGVTMSWDDGFLGARASRPHDDGFLGARASRPHQGLAQPRTSPPLGSTETGATALLRPGRCCSRRQGGCLQHRTEAQRRPKGQDAGGTPALPGDAVPAVRWGVSGGRLPGKPTCALWETPVCPQDKGSWGGNTRLPLPTRLNGVGSIPFQWLAIGLRPRLNAGVAFAAYWNPGLAPGDFL